MKTMAIQHCSGLEGVFVDEKGIERFHVTSQAFDRYLKMRLHHIGGPCELYIVKKAREIFMVSSLFLHLKFLLER